MNTKNSKKKLAYQYYNLKNQAAGGNIIPQIEQLHLQARKINYSRLQGKLERMKHRILRHSSTISLKSHSAIPLKSQSGGQFENLIKLGNKYNELLACCQEYGRIIPEINKFQKDITSIVTFLTDWLSKFESGEIPVDKDVVVSQLREKINQLNMQG